MENNQHSFGETNTSKKEEESFSNERPGQQLPSNSEAEKMNKTSDRQNERHSESSLPQNENDTLGTP